MNRKCDGFSLVEAVMAVGIVAFSMMAMLAIFPVGLKQNAVSLHETRAVHLARTVFATLRTLSPTQADCFGQEVHPAQLREKCTAFDRTRPQVCWYAGFPAEGAPKITSVQEDRAAYKIGVWFRQAGTQEMPVSASRVTLLIEPQDQSGPFQFEAIVEDGP